MASSPSANCVHDVFLSFRGEDVRTKFRSHFLNQLSRKSITPFNDEKIVKGRCIGHELLAAIRGSRISIIAFSANYASSSWCLDELVEIMKCKEEQGQIVIPIFYDLDPSHVRKQTHGFGDIFNKTCKGVEKEKRLGWRRALTQAANLAGEDSRNWPNEAKMVEKIVNDVSNKLNSTVCNDFDGFVGIEDHMKNMNKLLELELEEVIMVGIWGPSGIGKTTIGRAMFNRLSCQFQGGSIFIDKTKKIYRRANSDDYNTKLYLQTQFLSDILNHKDIEIHHLRSVEERLGYKKVLVVFDDVDDQVLVNALVGKTTWFGSGSRIVIISKDKGLLRDCRIELRRIYEVHLPSKKLAFQMFCRCAFGQDSPPHGFMEVAIEAAKHTGNLPLGLNVLGSSLAGMKKEEWADRLPRLRNRMAGQIEGTLRDSYDRLKEEDKVLFRHIACLFNHKTCDYVTRLLGDSQLKVEVGLVTLADRCLIQILEDNVITMHDFLQEMGRDIVRQPCIEEPGKRQFLMDSKEICDVLVDGTGTESVSGIFLNLSEIEDTLSISEEAFRKMVNLRFLSIYGVLREVKEVILHLQGDFNHMWRQLRLLEWWGCSMKCLPSNFPARNLVELIMPDSHLEILWEGAQELKSLKKMDLRRSKKLKEFLNLSKATNLEEMYLRDCWSLEKIPSSIQNLNRLRKLDMKSCKNLQGLPTNIHLESLHSLNFSACSKLKSFPRMSKNISYLYLDETEIEEVPVWVEDISGLIYIVMNGCSNLKYISPNISKLKHLEVIFFSNSDALSEEGCYDAPSAVVTKTDNIWKNDVYISFCGKDGVRGRFLSHLVRQLSNNCVKTVMDYGNERGQSFEAVHAIRESRIAIVVLSKNYTSSTECFDELVEIMKCAEEIGQKVIPIFYGVEPSRIKRQILKLEKTCENKTVDKQSKWVQALTIVNQLHGYHSKNWDSEADLIITIADDISFGLNFTPKGVSHVLGTDDHTSKKKLWMCLESEVVRMLEGFRKVAVEVTKRASKISLRGKNMEEWIEMQNERTLIVLYNGLNWKEKALFRHIACFLNKETYKSVMRLLEYSELDVRDSLKMLFDKSLIQISEERVISMHHVLEKIGRDIVLEPFIHQPAMRKLLMDSKQGCDVLIDQNGTENVFGISFKVLEMEETMIRDKRFNAIRKLQFMRMSKERLYDKEVRFHLVKGLHSLRNSLNMT